MKLEYLRKNINLRFWYVLVHMFAVRWDSNQYRQHNDGVPCNEAYRFSMDPDVVTVASSSIVKSIRLTIMKKHRQRGEFNTFKVYGIMINQENREALAMLKHFSWSLKLEQLPWAERNDNDKIKLDEEQTAVYHTRVYIKYNPGHYGNMLVSQYVHKIEGGGVTFEDKI
uniref:Uncharacterized protein n=1 Tax=Glossina austeni TaxID=7395 RepID=A0A1A9VXY8_GLOAU